MSPTLVTLSRAISPGRSSWRGLHPLSPALHRISWILNYTCIILSLSRYPHYLLLTSCTLLSADQRRICPGFSPSRCRLRLLSRMASHLATLSGSLILSHPSFNVLKVNISVHIPMLTHVSLVTTGVSLVWVLYLVFSDHSDRVWSRLVSGQSSPGYSVQNAANCINIHCSTKLK